MLFDKRQDQCENVKVLENDRRSKILEGLKIILQTMVFVSWSTAVAILTFILCFNLMMNSRPYKMALRRK